MTRSTSRYTKHEREFAIAVICDFTCSWCRRTGDDVYDPGGAYWHIDHIKPRDAGGSDVLANKTLSCTSCNYK
jgi:5-methylcytosine-specific restriction endonuclease McrA